MKKLLAAIAFGLHFVPCSEILAQERKCGIDLIVQNKLATDPAFKAKFEELKMRDANSQSTVPTTALKTTGTVTVPIIFHFILNQTQLNQIGGESGIYARVQSQLNALNRDYNLANPDQSKIPAVFKSVVGNPQIVFAPAHRTPDNKATSGVEIKITTAPGFDLLNWGERRSADGGLDAWDDTKYLNVWVVNIDQQGVLGYAFEPSLAASLSTSNGATIDYLAFGQKQGLGQTFTSGIDSGRTLVHELGHYFTLGHIWGEKDVCSDNQGQDDDGISDTPQQDQPNYGCPSYPQPNCMNTTGGEMFMNYMDYVNDVCMQMFTKEQVNKMLEQFAPGKPSYGLTQNPELLLYPTAVKDIANNNEVIVFPNPSNGLFNINFATAPVGLTSIDVLNPVGQIVYSLETNNQNNSYSLNLSDLSKGIYVVQCKFDNAVITRKIVLQ